MIFTCRKQLLYNFLLYSICVASTWVFLKIVLGTDKGLDLTDEGLYLLAADPPTKNATWGFPFGWHTKPLFRLVNYDICSFRTLGAFLLFLAGGWLGNSLIATFTNREKISEGKLKFLKISGWIIGASGTLFYYGSLLTTPSYNWINLIGIYISAIGLFNILQLNEQKNKNDKLKKWKWIYLTAAGLFLTIPAKPTTVIFIVFLAFLIFSINYCIKSATKLCMQILLSLITLIFIAIVTEFWVSPLKDFLFEPLQGPKFDPEKSILDAITSFLVVPKIFVESLNEIKRPIQFIIFSGSVIFICSHLFLKTTFFKNSFHILGLSFLLVGCLLVANSAPWKIFGNQATFRFADSSVTTACLLLSFQMLIFGLIILGKKKTKRSNIKNKTLYLYLSVNLFLLTTPFVFAFGSGNGPYRLAAMASGIFLLSSLSSALLISLAAKTKYSLFGILLFSLFLVTIYIKDSRELPYRNSSIANQIQSIEVGKHRSKLKIDSFLANELEKLKDGACRNGWAFDTPLLGVVWYWASTVPYVLGAKVPDCLMLTLFTYPNSVCVADYMINNRLEKFDSKNAWILTNRKSSLDQQKSDEVRRVLDKLTNVTGRVFPRDYIIAASNQSLELWKPKDPSKKPLTYFNSSTLVKK